MESVKNICMLSSLDLYTAVLSGECQEICMLSSRDLYTANYMYSRSKELKQIEFLLSVHCRLQQVISIQFFLFIQSINTSSTISSNVFEKEIKSSVIYAK